MFLEYASPAGRALIDRGLYLPKAWTDDRQRCRDAGIDGGMTSEPKHQLAQAMIEIALDAEVSFG